MPADSSNPRNIPIDGKTLIFTSGNVCAAFSNLRRIKIDHTTNPNNQTRDRDAPPLGYGTAGIDERIGGVLVKQVAQTDAHQQQDGNGE
ncbi:MAG: hypothetical protein KatS3mg105_3634 [Gemmatales bacterium]|nr:MAG: hypothetical protein KatS3mg105_3634 [Gemmatales bacterium]